MSALKEVTSKTKANKAQRVFTEVSESIAESYQQRSKTKGAESNTKGAGSNTPALRFLRKNAYHLVVHYLQTGQIEALRPLFREEARRRAGTPSLEENPFHWALIGMFGWTDEKLSLVSRGRIAKQLLYAWWHQIPPYLIVGFLAQMKHGDKINEKVAKRTYEPWHPDYKKPAKADTNGDSGDDDGPDSAAPGWEDKDDNSDD